MDSLDDLFFDHRLQKKARVEPLYSSQKTTLPCPEPPTFDDFISTPHLYDDLMSFKPSHLISQTQKRDVLPENEAYDVMEGSQFGPQKPKSFNCGLSQPGKRFLSQLPGVSEVFRKSTTAYYPPPLPPAPKSPKYGSDDDLFSDRTHSGGSIGPGSCHRQTSDQCSSQDPNTQRQATHHPVMQYDTPQTLSIPDPGCGKAGKQAKLRSVEEIHRYRDIFSFPYFNIVQSLVLNDVLYTDKPLVVCAPTGSGKTAVFELAILRLLMTAATQNIGQIKIIYMAPIKALCSERYLDWKDKFEPFGLKCKELTGDTDMDDYFQLQEVNIVTTTPEKWDSMTRKWRDNKSLVQMVRLFLVDEVHILNDDTRGATMEAVISRMKTVQSALSWTNQPAMSMRFIAISATIPNIEDIAEWLGSGEEKAVFHSLDEKYRPVRLRRVVLGYNWSDESSDFKFDISLNYKMAGIIHTYSENKPTLVFCSTRKSVQQAAAVLVKDSKFILNSQHKERLVRCANFLRDSKLRELVLCGVGYHHAGMELHDRKAVEELFTAADLPVLFATSTLAMGVNLPAHLVVIKSTTQYHMGAAQEYSDTQVLQMIGRAGRPQFDTSATAVIMTKMCNKFKYEALIKGTQLLESSLHKHLIEYLNAEICLRTITDVTVALEWIRSTLLYIRVMKNPKHYDMPVGLTKNQVEKRLQDLCVRNLNFLSGIELIKMDDDHFEIQPTEQGRMMARFCIKYSTMKKFSELSGTVSMSDMVTVLSSCKEFSDIQLRVTERRHLNMLNKDKNRATIRYPMIGKIKSKEMKVNCLIQAQLGSLTVQDFALSQDTTKIFRVAQRVAKCLVEYMWSKPHFQTLLTSVMLCKCLKSRLWENSRFVTKQLEGIGPTLSNAFVNAGITSFQKIEETNPRELELIVNRHPPFGNLLRDAVTKLPKYELSIEQVAKYSPVSAELAVTVCLANPESIKANKAVGSQHFSVLLIGDADNNVILKAKLSDHLLVKEGSWWRKITVERANKGNHLDVHLISEEWVGLDVESTYTPYYTGTNSVVQVEDSESSCHENNVPSMQDGASPQLEGERRSCFHRCLNKSMCGHECCKIGILVSNSRSVKRALAMPLTHGEPHPGGTVSCYIDNLRTKTEILPDIPGLKRRKVSMNAGTSVNGYLERFAYKPHQPLQFTTGQHTSHLHSPNPGDVMRQRSTGWEELNMYASCREDDANNLEGPGEDDTLPDVIPGKFEAQYCNESTPNQTTEWKSDKAEDYGEFGLQTPPQTVVSHQVYTSEDFQDSEDEDATLLRRGDIILPTITRHQHYTEGSRRCAQPYTTQIINSSYDGGLNYSPFTGRQSIGELHRGSSPQEQNRCWFDPFHGRTNQNVQVFRGQVAAQGRQLSGQGCLAKGQGHLTGYGPPERGKVYRSMQSKEKLGKSDYYDLTLDDNELNDQDKSVHSFRVHGSWAGQMTPSDRGCIISPSASTRPGQQKRENTQAKLPHKQGQVFAWPVTSKRNDMAKPAVSKDGDITSSGQNGDGDSQDSQSDSPCIPRARDFVLARQVYEDNAQKKTTRLPVRPMVPVKTSPAFSSDEDEEAMISYLDNLERVPSKANTMTSAKIPNQCCTTESPAASVTQYPVSQARVVTGTVESRTGGDAMKTALVQKHLEDCTGQTERPDKGIRASSNIGDHSQRPTSDDPIKTSGTVVSCGDKMLLKAAPAQTPTKVGQSNKEAIQQEIPASSSLSAQPENNNPALENEEVHQVKPAVKDLPVLLSEPLSAQNLGDIERNGAVIEGKQELGDRTTTTKPDFSSQSPVACQGMDFFFKQSSPKEKTVANFSSIFDGIF